MQIYYFWQNIQNLPKIINGFYNLITMFTSFAPGMPEKDSTRQAIADSWPNKMDDVCARKEWGWTPSYNLKSMTRDMIKHLRVKLGVSEG